jgi:hypothetical protein
VDGGALVVALFVSCLRSGLFPFWVRAARPLVHFVFGCLGLSGPAGLTRPVFVLPVPLVFLFGVCAVRLAWSGRVRASGPVAFVCGCFVFWGVLCFVVVRSVPVFWVRPAVPRSHALVPTWGRRLSY